jgi:hypothetical protein
MPNSTEDQPANEPDVEIAEIDKRVEAWVSSKEGTEQLLAAREAARRAAKKVLSDAEVQPDQLRKAVTL